MSAHLDIESDGNVQTRRDGSLLASSATEWVCLGATPVFALMALLTSVGVLDMADMHMPMAHGGSLLSGMSLMYLLMSVFHAAPWLRRLSG
jgi:hypothetical protein